MGRRLYTMKRPHKPRKKPRRQMPPRLLFCGLEALSALWQREADRNADLAAINRSAVLTHRAHLKEFAHLQGLRTEILVFRFFRSDRAVIQSPARVHRAANRGSSLNIQALGAIRIVLG